MKKTYIIPATAIYAVSTETLMVVSDPNVGISDTGSVDAASVEAKGTSASSYNVWNDDWSE